MSNVPEDILSKLIELPPENREKVFRYIHREKEVGQVPSREKLEEIIFYLSQKQNPSSQKLNNWDMEDEDIEYEKKPSDYIASYNCTVCKFIKESKCHNHSSFLYEHAVSKQILCKDFGSDIL
jgi:hypothetical protein